MSVIGKGGRWAAGSGFIADVRKDAFRPQGDCAIFTAVLRAEVKALPCWSCDQRSSRSSWVWPTSNSSRDRCCANPRLSNQSATRTDGGDADRAEFAADLSSFANTGGGDLLIGIDEAGGVPTRVTPFVGDADGEMRRLQAIARDGINPRLVQLAARAIPVASGGHVLVFRVARSLSGPHMVVLQRRNKFWARDSTGKYALDVDQLRRKPVHPWSGGAGPGRGAFRLSAWQKSLWTTRRLHLLPPAAS